MKIEVVDNLILSYAIIGDVDNSMDIDDELLPADFIENFEPKKYKYENEQVLINDDFEVHDYYSDEIAVFGTPNVDGHDDELRKMFADMQVQLVQASTMVMQLTKQNAELAKQLVITNQEVEKLKGDVDDENAIS